MLPDYFVYFQEFECGVQFEGLEKNKQEWSFTLYDFDGHGKITREVNDSHYDVLHVLMGHHDDYVYDQQYMLVKFGSSNNDIFNTRYMWK
jgi:hypothetical protein